MVVKIIVIVFFTCLVVVLTKPADNPFSSFASNIPGLYSLGGVREGISHNYQGAQDNIGKTVNSLEKFAEKGMEAGINAAKLGAKIFTSPLDMFRNVAGNFGK